MIDRTALARAAVAACGLAHGPTNQTRVLRACGGRLYLVDGSIWEAGRLVMPPTRMGWEIAQVVAHRRRMAA